MGSQFTYMVGLVFPTMGNSWLSDLMTCLGSHEFPLFSLCDTQLLSGTNFLSFTLYFLLRIANPHFFTHFRYLYLRLVEVS